MTLADAKHRQILDAAIAEFHAHGFAGASMDRIAHAASVSKRTVYNHFPGKQALFEAILDEMAAHFADHLTVTYVPGLPIADQLRALAWCEGRILLSEPCLRTARMALGESLRDPALAQALDARMTKFSIFRDFITAAHADGALHAPDPQRSARQFLGLIKSQGFWPNLPTATPATQAEMTAIVESTVALFLAHHSPGA